jgi:hypothetical protein
VQNIGNKETLPPPSDLTPSFPSSLEAIVMKGLRHAPEERFSTALELLVELEAAFGEWTGPDAESLVAGYLEQVAGEQLRERRRRLEAAQNGMDANGPRSGTMRAITLENLAETSNLAHFSSATLASPIFELSVADEAMLTRRFPIKAVFAGIGVLSAVLIAQLVFLRSSTGAGEVEDSSVPTTAPVVLPEKKVPVVEPAAPSEEEKPAAADEGPDPVPERESTGTPAIERPRVRPTWTRTWKVTPRPQHEAMANQTQSSKPTSEQKPQPKSEEPTAPAPVDAWNPNDFGDRL